MPPEDWQRVQEIFFRVVDLDRTARAAVLDSIGAEEPEVRRELDVLLAGEHDGDDRLDRPIVRLRQSEPSLAGQRLGPYRVIEEIGRGGLGIVYLARREDDFEQNVALKVIKRGMDTDEVVRRFHTERRILGRLVHHRIARILDGGSTDDGRPYFVMEHVTGPRLDIHTESLPTRARLELFCQICEAVRFAHQNLVVHRDLKPSNVLVTEEGVKLLDFGIAKVLRKDGNLTTELGRSGARPMTLDYASPEQVRGGHITTATDIYSLGVVLYELLTGRLPYSLDDCDTQESYRRICEEEPISPRRLSRELDQDLASIVLEALHKKPERRYPSVESLADDVRRYLAGHPVRAHAGSWGYYTGKFLRRYRLAIVAASTISLVTLAVTVLWQQAERARDQARLEQKRAERVTELLVDLFDAPDPDKSKGKTLSARDVIERGKQEALGGLDEEPEVRGQLLQALGRVYRKLGAYEEATLVLEEALRLRRSHLDEQHPLLAESLNDLAFVLQLRGQLAEATTLILEAVAIHRENAAENPLDLARGLTNLGNMQYLDGDYGAAEESLEESLAIKRRQGAPRSELLTTSSSLASVRRAQGRLEEAAGVYEEILKIRRNLHGPLHTDVARSLTALATARRDLGQLAEAEMLLRQALEIQENNEGASHPRVGRTHRILGTVLQAAGDLEAALASFESALDIQRPALGEGHRETSITRARRAWALGRLGRYSTCEQEARDVIGISRSQGQGDSWWVADAQSVLGGCLSEQGRDAEAEPLLRESHVRLEQARGQHFPATRAAARRLESFTNSRSPR